jgi:hypothetical protein
MIRTYALASVAALAASAVLLMSPSASRAGYTVSIDAPGTQSSTVTGVTTEDFNAPLPLGSYPTLVTPIGTYTTTAPAAGPGLSVVGADAFGGANNTRYMALGMLSGLTQSVTLTFNAPVSYFGLYWSAVDANNTLVVLDGSTVVETINLATITGLIATSNYPASEYLGNPNNGKDAGENFVYLNIGTNAGSVITSVIFENTTNSTFESDNHSILPVPEPTSVVMLGLGLTTLSGITLRRGMVRTAKTGV